MGNLFPDPPLAPFCDRCGIRSHDLETVVGARTTSTGVVIVNFGLCCWHCREELPQFDFEPG